MTVYMNLASVDVKRNKGFVRLCFNCGCRAHVDLYTENLSELRFCMRQLCPSSQFAREVYREHVEEEAAREARIKMLSDLRLTPAQMLASLRAGK